MTTQTISIGPNPVLEIEHVGGDVILEGWENTDLQAQGDNVHIEQSGDSLKISCDSDLKLLMPPATRMIISFVGGDLKVENLDGPIDVAFVGGDIVMRNLKGQVSLNGLVGGDTKFENVSRVSMDANKHGSGPDLSERVKHKVEQATRRAEQKMLRAENKIKKAEQKLHQHAYRKANIDLGRWKWKVSPGSYLARPMNEPVSEEERMTILKMLQEKKITSEQADSLLAALEGGK